MSAQPFGPTTRRAQSRAARPLVLLPLGHDASIAMHAWEMFEGLPDELQARIVSPFHVTHEDSDPGYLLEGSDGHYVIESYTTDGGEPRTRQALDGEWTAIGRTSLIDWSASDRNLTTTRSESGPQSLQRCQKALAEAMSAFRALRGLGDVIKPLARFLESLDLPPDQRIIKPPMDYSPSDWYQFDRTYDKGMTGQALLMAMHARMLGDEAKTLFTVRTFEVGDTLYQRGSLPTLDKPDAPGVGFYVLGSEVPGGSHASIGGKEYELARVYQVSDEPGSLQFVVHQELSKKPADQYELDPFRYTLHLVYTSTRITSNAFALAFVTLSKNALGLKWHAIGTIKPAHGSKIVNGALSEALETSTTFTPAQLLSYKMPSFTVDDYIWSGSEYYRSTESPFTVLRLSPDPWS